MLKLHSQKAKNQFRAVKPQLTAAFASLRSVLLTEIQELVAEKIPTRLLDNKAGKIVSDLVIQRFDDFTAGLLRMDQ